MDAERFSGLAVAAEHIAAGDTIVIASGTGLAYSARHYHGLYCGKAVENLRAGFKIRVENGEAREDDA